ncbi:LacI family DNA-binding transcriptional regulator [Actinoplanes sp. N902-109]|uniref:LacI family DNA-binding transcriptional regulator n=1 Tax=Actinoplanes sp. (strain N902-109) TaxID=649831 RepID=UPI0003295424|nr:LacI family DNA-binding transcriptional regulator [Actinoplanes sp. N902-109]AGL17258.1 transcriptional regulator [Actinoplanes sp. N902-109]
MTVTIRDVARRAGVSPSSVCRALADPAAVRADTRERVQQAVQELGYYPNRAARGLSTGRTGNLGVVLPDLGNPFFPAVVKAVQSQARACDYAVFLSDIDEEPAAEAQLIRAMAKQVDGFLLCSPRSADEELRSFAGQVPIVVLNRRIAPFPSVTADNPDGMRQAVAHLHALGHRRIGYVSGPRASWSNRERWRGLRTSAGVLGGIELVEAGSVPPTVDGGIAIADVVLAAGVTAVLAYNDLTALGLLHRFQARGVAVPEDISVVGFDGIMLSALVSPALTTVAVAAEQIGRVGVDLLLETMADPERSPVRRVLPAQLIVRSSTGPVKAGRTR